MCFIIRVKSEKDFKKVRIPKVAKKDITVYKVLQLNGYSPYRSNFKYEKGYHYYQTDKEPAFTFFESSFPLRLEINRGLHSCKTKHAAEKIRWFYPEGRKIVKMIIPKGAKYYENEEHYVSDQLIYI